MNGKKKKWCSRILFLFGFMICAYPLFSSVYERSMQTGAIQTYESDVKKTDINKLDKELEEAKAYNDRLLQTQDGYIEGIENDHLNYENMLDISEGGIMASIEIPKIDVNLPIYHGTKEEQLSNGVGHLENSSLPVGGKGTHCLLTGHRGLPSSKLFTRLDELEKKDLFYIQVCGKTLAYQIRNIEVVEPEALEQVYIEPDKDKVSLITCTPYGINTHRLVVTGERVPYKKSIKKNILPKIMSLRELLFTILPFAILLIVLIYELLKHRKEQKTCAKN